MAVMEPIGICRELCPVHGPVYFIEHLPEESMVSQQALDNCQDFMKFDGSTLMVLGENGTAKYILTPADYDTYFAALDEWLPFDPPVTRHV